jgi:hypothetical protein
MLDGHCQTGVVLRNPIRLVLLTVILVGLLIFAWVNDHPIPAEPQGKLLGLFLTFLVRALPALLIFWLVRKPTEYKPCDSSVKES